MKTDDYRYALKNKVYLRGDLSVCPGDPLFEEKVYSLSVCLQDIKRREISPRAQKK